MAIVVKDRVKETTAVTGTGTATLLGAANGFQSFAAIGNGNITYYAIANSEDGTWEVGKGTYSTTGPTLTRDAVYASSNAGALVNFAVGIKDIFCTYPAEKAIYEEPNGNTLIDGGPLTVIGSGVTGYTTFSAALAEMYANINSFAQLYAQNLNDGSEASADFVAYNDLGDGNTNFVDMGINSSNYSSSTYPIFSAGSAYVFNDGGEMFLGSATDDLVLFAGGTDVADEAVRIDKTTKAVTTVGDVNVGGALDVTSAATFGSTVLLNADPTLNLQAATKQYVDTAVSTGLHLHQPVRVATTGNLTATYNNGASGVGATLTNSGTQVALSVDGISLSVNDRVLVWQQTSGAQNGVYVVTTVGSGSTNWVLTRSADANNYDPQTDTGLGGGDYFYVQEGTTGAGDSYVCTNTGTITFGTTAITFAQFSGAITYTGGTNIDVTGQLISLTGTVAATNGGTGTSTVATGDLLYGSGTNTWGKLAAGAAYKSLVMNAGGTNVEWNAVALNQSGSVSGSLPATNGGTGQNAYSTGDMLYSDATNSLAKLPGNTSTTKRFLTQTGTGSGSAAPVWGTVSGSDVSGAVSLATNISGGAANQIVYQTGANTTSFVTAPTSSNTFLGWNGSAFAWSAAGSSITDDNTTNTDYYPVWANATSGAMTTAYVSSTKMGFNPSTGLFKSTIVQAGTQANFIQSTGAATTLATTITAAGSDTNVALALRTQGTGAIDLAAGSRGVNISNGGTVTAITTTASGASYTSAPSVTISSPTTAGGVQATASAVMGGTGTITVTNGGSGYTVNDVLTFVGGTGSAESVTVTAVSSGVITAVTFRFTGQYTVVPTNPVSVTGGTGTGATFTCTWKVLSLSITNAGSGYVEQPTVTFSGGGGGSGAAAYATVGGTTVVKSIGQNMDFTTPNGIGFRVYDGGGTSPTGYWSAGSGTSNPYLWARGGTNTIGRITSSGTGNLEFQTNSGSQTQFTVSHTASAVNYVQVTGAATTARPAISAQGSDTNVGLSFVGKGNARIAAFFNNSATSSFHFSVGVGGSTSAVNYLDASGSAAGSAPALSAQGSDTNIDLSLTTKGTGSVNFTANAIQRASIRGSDGYSLLGVNASGTQSLAVAPNGSAVNYIQIISGLTTAAPVISALGSDANIDLTLTPKGTGVVQFGTYTATGSSTFSIAGYITIKDAGGTLRNLAVIA